MSDTAIELELDLSFFAAGPISGSTWDTLVRIDGAEHRFHGGKNHRIPCSPGAHEIEVEFAAAGAQVVAEAVGFKAGLERTRVEVPAGKTFKLVYHGGMFWKMGDHSLEKLG